MSKTQRPLRENQPKISSLGLTAFTVCACEGVSFLFRHMWTFWRTRTQTHAGVRSLLNARVPVVVECEACLCAPSWTKQRIIYNGFLLHVEERVSTGLLQPILYVQYYSLINIQYYFTAGELRHTTRYTTYCSIKNWPHFYFFDLYLGKFIALYIGPHMSACVWILPGHLAYILAYLSLCALRHHNGD